MVTDQTVTHVLMMCDSAYAEKANARRAGVGTESQILSKEIYQKVAQSKFIPIFCELDDKGEPYLPVFLSSRIGIDFSNAEAVNKNWEQLVRLLHGKPLHVKPAVGKPPSYLDEARPNSGAAGGKLASLRQALVSGRGAIGLFRGDFLEAVCEYIDGLRVRQDPKVPDVGQLVLSTCVKLKPARDLITDWVLMECQLSAIEFPQALLDLLERLIAMKARPQELQSWNQLWLESHEVFVYETFIYVVGALLKRQAYTTLNEVFSHRYLQPDGSRYREGQLETFTCFWASSTALQVLADSGRQLLSPAAELIRKHADRVDLTFEMLQESELLTLMMTFITPAAHHWYPGTLLYQSRRAFKFFARAAHHKAFLNLATITGVESAEVLKTAVLQSLSERRVDQWEGFWMRRESFAESFNLNNLDSVS